MVDLSDKVVLITGAGSGMGRACVEHALANGASVFAVDIDAGTIAPFDDVSGVIGRVTDVADIAAIPGLVADCVDQLGGLHGLVNAAGVFQTKRMPDITCDDFDRIFSLNVRGLFFLQQEAAKVMTSGSIVNFASTAARVPRPNSSHYAASKAAVVSITRSAATAWAAQGIRVNAICPGVIETPMIESILAEQAVMARTDVDDLLATWRGMNPLGRLGKPSEVSALVSFLLSDEASYITGESIGVNGGADDI